MKASTDIKSGMSCKRCSEFFTEEFVEDFKNGICLPCQTEIFMDNEDKLDLECLTRYNRKHKTNYTIEDFWDLAALKEISKESCKGFPRMREIIEWHEMIEAEYEAEKKYWESYQPTLFDQLNQLPF